jgi:hypothetical protein
MLNCQSLTLKGLSFILDHLRLTLGRAADTDSTRLESNKESN